MTYFRKSSIGRWLLLACLAFVMGTVLALAAPAYANEESAGENNTPVFTLEGKKQPAVPSTQSTYGGSYAIVKSDGYLHITDSSHSYDYGTIWGDSYTDAKNALREVTVLYVDSDVTKFDEIRVEYYSGSRTTSNKIGFDGDAFYFGPCNLQKIVFLTYNGVNRCSSMDNTYMFRKQQNLTQVVNFDKTRMTTVPNGCFYGCSALSSIKLPSTLLSIGDYSFYDCDSLKTLDVPSSVKTIGTSSASSAVFGRCDNLQKLILRSTSRVVINRNILRDANPNLKIYVPNSALSSYKEKVNTNGWYSYGDHLTKMRPFMEVANIPAQTYTGKAIKPAVSVTWMGNKISSGYTVTYANNIKKGTATVTVKGDKAHPGTVKKTFKIVTKAGWNKNSIGWWYTNNDGSYSVNKWQKIGGYWYHFDSSGYMQTGWQSIGGSWYYFKPGSSGKMVTGWQWINGYWYFFDKSSGVMASDEWREGYWLNGDGSWTYGYKGSWHKKGNRWWFGDESGWYAKSTYQWIDGKKYYFSYNGWCTNP